MQGGWQRVCREGCRGYAGRVSQGIMGGWQMVCRKGGRGYAWRLADFVPWRSGSRECYSKGYFVEV